MVVLRLLIEEPDSSSGLSARIRDEFASARWSRSAVPQACKRLHERGLVRPLDRDLGREVVRLETTVRGRAHYEHWQRGDLRGRLRDNVSTRLRLCGSVAEARELAVWLRLCEDGCDDQQADAKERLLVHAHRMGRRRAATGDDFVAMREELALIDEVVHWELEAERICKLRTKLEEWLASIEPVSAGEMEEPGDGRAFVS
jgi:hypothetical protein